MDSRKQLVDSYKVTRQYVDSLIDTTLKEMKSIFPKIVVIINWVVDQLIMLFRKLTIKGMLSESK